MKIGVFVGRFQTPELHNGYKYALSELQINYDDYIIVIGSSTMPNKRNLLDFETRKAMIEEYVYKKPIIIMEIVDLNDNDKWNKELERSILYELNKIKTNVNISDIYLIGSRDSFIFTYNGYFNTVKLKPYFNYNSTEQRNQITFLPNYYFICGLIYSFIKKKIGFDFNWLKPFDGYNSNWSKGYIYSFNNM